MAGEWDCKREPFEETTTYLSLYSHFVDGTPWKETRYYDEAKSAIEQNGEFLGYTDAERFLENRCQYVDDLYDSIRKDGLQASPDDVPFDERRPWSHYDPTGVSVTIARDGEILLHDGTHRLAIARILGLESVPVHVLVRHEQWQDLRSSIANRSEIAENHVGHPDLRDVL